MSIARKHVIKIEGEASPAIRYWTASGGVLYETVFGKQATGSAGGVPPGSCERASRPAFDRSNTSLHRLFLACDGRVIGERVRPFGCLASDRRGAAVCPWVITD